MQCYVADAARRTGRQARIIVPARAKPTGSTRWAEAQGAEMHYVRPGYLSVVRARTREIVRADGGVRWDPAGAIADARAQVANLPADVRRVVIPCGTGLIAAGVLAGLVDRGIPALLVAVSDMMDVSALRRRVQDMCDGYCAVTGYVRHPTAYEKGVRAYLPDGSRLDPWYAAKALSYVEDGDCLWVTGIRPVAAMD